MDIVKLLNEAADDILDWGAYAGEYFQNKHDLEGCAQQYRDAAAELEAREPDYWVSVDGVYVDFGMRRPMAEDAAANWCARTEVNQHINDSMGDQPGLRLHLEGLYRYPPSAVPEGWQPIETAPKDGRYILLGRPENDDQEEVCVIGYWLDALEDGIDYMGHDAGFTDADYQVFAPSRSFGAVSHRSTGSQPTHWMPLPAAPDSATTPCPNGLLPDGPTCPSCGKRRGPSGVDGGSWVHVPDSAPGSGGDV